MGIAVAVGVGVGSVVASGVVVGPNGVPIGVRVSAGAAVAITARLVGPGDGSLPPQPTSPRHRIRARLAERPS